ncbi:MAG: ribosome maturation factor RimP [Clostridiales bacterium]|nr:ribosome maturation factor RimP [Clostridiales bacterium]
MAGEKNIEQIVAQMLEPIMEENSCELVDVEFVKEGPNWYLRVYADKEGAITIDDCEKISRTLEKELDKRDPISQAYILEVSSPGLDRPLKKEADFIRYAGELVDLKLYRPFRGSKEWQGTLKGLEDNIVTIIEEDGSEISFGRKEIASIRLAVIF